MENIFKMNIFSEIMQSFAPPPVLKVSEWADQYRKLSSESSASPGDWDTSVFEYQRGIMDIIHEDEIETLVMMTSAQVGKTEIINNIIGYLITNDPGPMINMNPTIRMGEAWSKDRFSPMVRDTEILHKIIKSPKTRDSNNTITHKTFPGGHLTICGANSPASLAGRPIRIVITDDIDRNPASCGSEGDPILLITKRTAGFWNRFILHASTPTIKDLSRIESIWKVSDQRRFYVPCHKCKHKQHLRWGQVKWQKDKYNNHLTGTAKYECEDCKTRWNDFQRWQNVRKGKWKATVKPKIKSIAGVHLNDMDSPLVVLEKMVDKFLDSKDDRNKLQVFVNTSLGEPFEEDTEKMDDFVLYKRREKYPAQVPAGGLVIVAGVDVQKDRLECEVAAFGIGDESWNIDYWVIWGDTNLNNVWNDLDAKLETKFEHESGLSLKISCICIDSGYATDNVYKFCKGKEERRIFATKGSGTVGIPIISMPSKRNKFKVKLFHIGTDTAKLSIYSRLKMEDAGAGYMHFPLERDSEYFAQLCAEEIRTKYTRGYPHRIWRQKRARNEALDCRVNALTALAILNPNYEKIAESFKKIKKEADNIEDQKKPKRNNQRSWVNGWRN
jgi:phage terminase large subunit GpA-like protein